MTWIIAAFLAGILVDQVVLVRGVAWLKHKFGSVTKVPDE